MAKGEPRQPKGPTDAEELHSLTIKIPLSDYRTLLRYASGIGSTPTTVVRTLTVDLCRAERSLAAHKK